MFLRINKTKKVVHLLFILLTLSVPFSILADELDGLDSFLDQALVDWQVPGAAVSVIKDGNVVFMKTMGVKEVGTTDPIDENTLFGVASMTKSYTAAALGLLVDRGELNWDDKITQFLPTFKMYDDVASKEMTIRDLLCHRGGFPEDNMIWYDRPGISRQDILDELRHMDKGFSFRTNFKYSNPMYLVAGMIIEEVSGMLWEDFIRTNIFVPLGMTRSAATHAELQNEGNKMNYHAFYAGNVNVITVPYSDNISPAATISQSIHDATTWLMLHMNRGQFGGTTFLSQEVMDEMHAEQMIIRDPNFWHVPFTEAVGAKASSLNAYGLGWIITEYKSKKIIWHAGSLDGIRSMMAYIPDLNAGVVILTNSGSFLYRTELYAEAAMFQVFDMFMEDVDRNWSTDLLAVVADERNSVGVGAQAYYDSLKDPNNPPTLDLDEYEGSYSDKYYGDLDITLVNNELHLSFSDTFQGVLEHLYGDTYLINTTRLYFPPFPVTFELNGQGRKVENLNIGGGLFYRSFKK